ncbi:uncharacterized protein OCT59_022541 [Rhizophagus irregularis]|uniref:uncharacterized protein n=1 Tax=Rhizophagus irregularis TaxID=588596 RepID=UPI000CACD748|nr:hypothetical protein OCT59_022541 [Rhizophagus irregularis]
MEKDARMCDYAKEGEDPHEDKGVISPWFDTDEECMANISNRVITLATKITVQRSRKPKTNDFVSALGMVLEKYNLSVDSTPEQLSEHAKE